MLRCHYSAAQMQQIIERLRERTEHLYIFFPPTTQW